MVGGQPIFVEEAGGGAICGSAEKRVKKIRVKKVDVHASALT